LNLFIERATAAGAVVKVAADRRRALALALDSVGRGPVALAPSALAGELGLAEALERAGVESVDAGDPAAVATAAVGITEADAAVAATGTLFSDSTAVEGRLASTLPPRHVVLLRRDRVVATLGEVLGRLAGGPPPFCAFTTGPSRTADIERVLTIGVHGPRVLEIIVVGGEGCGGGPQETGS